MVEATSPTKVADAIAGAPQDKRALTVALGFEKMLVTQLAKELLPSDLMGDDNPYADVLPGAFADGIEQAGGLGLAPVLAQTIGGQS
jgi:hypothetical protein